jgi:hypothetical protein
MWRSLIVLSSAANQHAKPDLGVAAAQLLRERTRNAQDAEKRTLPPLIVTNAGARVDDTGMPSSPSAVMSPRSRTLGSAALVGVTHFVQHLKQSHRKRKHLEYKDMMRKLVAAGKLQLVTSGADATQAATADKRTQGNEEMYTEDMMRERVALRRSILVGEACEKWWVQIMAHFPGLDAIPLALYVSIFSTVYSVLIPASSFRERVELAIEDYQNDAAQSHKKVLDHDTFCMCLFELVDIWTDHVSEAEYTDFLTEMRMTWSGEDRFILEHNRILSCYASQTVDGRIREDRLFTLKSRLPDPFERFVRSVEGGFADAHLEHQQRVNGKNQTNHSRKNDGRASVNLSAPPEMRRSSGDAYAHVKAHYLDETTAYKHYKSQKSDVFSRWVKREAALPALANMRFSGQQQAPKPRSPKSRPRVENHKLKQNRDIFGYGKVADRVVPTVGAPGDDVLFPPTSPSPTNAARGSEPKHVIPPNGSPSRSSKRRGRISRVVSVALDLPLEGDGVNAADPLSPLSGGVLTNSPRTAAVGGITSPTAVVDYAEIVEDDAPGPVYHGMPKRSPAASERYKKIRSLQGKYLPPALQYLGYSP